jgi:thiol peroxidase
VKTILAAACACLLLGACASSGQTDTTTRNGLVSLKGKPLTLEGKGVRVGQAAPDAVAVANDMSDRRLSEYRGKTVILSTVPSLETAVCDKETRTFNERASALGPNVVVVTVSMDLPMTQKKWCGAAGIDRVVTLSDYKYRQVGADYGLRIQQTGLLARAVTVIDPKGVVTYQQIVPELASEPNYDAAIAAAMQAAK